MTEAPLREYLAAAKRQWWIVLQAAVVVGLVAAYFAATQDEPPFRAQAILLVDAEELGIDGGSQEATDIRFAALAGEVTQPDVLAAAADAVEDVSVERVAAVTSAAADPDSQTLTVITRSADPAVAVPVANAVAEAFIVDKTAAVTSQREERLVELESRLVDDQAELAAAEREIGAAEAFGGDPASAQARKDAATLRYGETYSQIGEIEDQLALQEPTVELVFPAQGTSQESQRGALELGLVGALIGALLGVGLAALREAMDTRVRNRHQAERESRWRVLVEIPKDRSLHREGLVVIDRPDDRVAESVRELRTSLHFLSTDLHIRSLAVTSPQPGDGKTVLAANLAASFAQSGLDTVLVSGDLRRPKVETLFDVHPSTPGLVDLLSETDAPSGDVSPRWASLGDRVRRALVPTSVPRLSLLAAGTKDDSLNPGELLSSIRAYEVFDHLRTLGDMVVVDCPPTTVTDAALVSGQVDGVLAVVSLGKTDRGALHKAHAMLESAPGRVLGIVLNRTSPSSAYSGYYGEAQPAPGREASMPSNVSDLKRSGS